MNNNEKFYKRLKGICDQHCANNVASIDTRSLIGLLLDYIQEDEKQAFLIFKNVMQGVNVLAELRKDHNDIGTQTVVVKKITARGYDNLAAEFVVSSWVSLLNGSAALVMISNISSSGAGTNKESRVNKRTANVKPVPPIYSQVAQPTNVPKAPPVYSQVAQPTNVPKAPPVYSQVAQPVSTTSVAVPRKWNPFKKKVAPQPPATKIVAQAPPPVPAVKKKDFEISGTFLVEYNGKDVHVTIPNGITRICNHAFSNKAIRSVILPDTVTTIEARAFSECSALREITAKGVNHIGEEAFYNCQSLDTVIVPALTSAHAYAFSGCDVLRKIYSSSGAGQQVNTPTYAPQLAMPNNMRATAPQVNNLNDFEIIGTFLVKYKGSDKHVTIPDGVTRICDGAFVYYGSVESISTTKSLKTIEADAFANHSSLRKVDMPGLEDVRNSAFKFCGKLGEINAPLLRTIGDEAFKYCGKLRTVEFPNVEEIGDSAFENCGNLCEVELPKVEEIGDSAFELCRKLELFNAPLLNKVGERAFTYCDRLKAIYAPCLKGYDGKVEWTAIRIKR